MIPATRDAADPRYSGSSRRRWPAHALRILFALACLLATSMAALGEDPGNHSTHSRFLRFDSVQSRASFEVTVLLMFSVKGEFGSVSGGVHVDGDQARVEAAIDANAVSMSREANEKWVKSAEFFDVDRHPQIFFDSLPFPLARLRKGGTLPGTLGMRGVTRPVVFEVRPSACKRPAVDCAVEAKGTVRRSEFGMDTRRGALSDKVELNLKVRVIVPAASADTP